MSLTKYQEYIAKVPRAVIWLDDPVNPTGGEYYFSSVTLEESHSRLNAIATKIISVTRESPVSNRLSWFKRASDTAEIVPWLTGNHEPPVLAGIYAVAAPKELWSELTQISDLLKPYEKPGNVAYSKLAKQERRTLVRGADFGNEGIHPFLRVPGEQPQRRIVSVADAFTGFERSKRILPLEPDPNEVLQFAEGVPKGVIPLTAHQVIPAADGYKNIVININNTTIEKKSQCFFGVEVYFTT